MSLSEVSTNRPSIYKCVRAAYEQALHLQVRASGCRFVGCLMGRSLCQCSYLELGELRPPTSQLQLLKTLMLLTPGPHYRDSLRLRRRAA